MNNKQLRAIGHQLKPVVIVAQSSISPGVTAEVDRALTDHEIIKVKIALDDREQRAQIVTQLCEDHQATKVQMTGKIALLYKKNPQPHPKKSNLIRYLADI